MKIEIWVEGLGSPFWTTVPVASRYDAAGQIRNWVSNELVEVYNDDGELQEAIPIRRVTIFRVVE